MSGQVRIAARGMLPMGYWGHGRHFPRNKQVELSVSLSEYEAISADPNVVCVIIPEAHQEAAQAPARAKGK